MISDDRIDQESSGVEDGQQIVPKGTQFLRKGYRDLDEGELTSPTAVRFMLAEIDRLGAETAELRPFRERSYTLETRVAILEERPKRVWLMTSYPVVLLPLEQQWWDILAICGRFHQTATSD
jgi:hypothetical protein